MSTAKKTGKTRGGGRGVPSPRSQKERKAFIMAKALNLQSPSQFYILCKKLGLPTERCEALNARWMWDHKGDWPQD